uniref:NADH-ubiquinone oxidoreductase chain 4L n=1 Tax=Coleonyx variegatus TaxID=52435 RepID=A1IGD7_COLVA|nr:NADH dehydrogenase subunit 4L [Coleonyx variegatus]BAF43974.1 NADH dehydrogenase subunit 4L [Coleonyx variegatus]
MTNMQFTMTLAFILSISGLAMHRTHLVSALLCIETMMLALFMFLVLLAQNTELTTNALFPMALLTFSACEASTGLAILVASTRTHASDHLKTMNLLQC